ncbi:MAG: ATP-binding protein [Symploca sp. SIO1C4]|uniref:ATP-binding protein n=1 Tax=Symploca sp. SIO1C4 TaxID=2607765 RepID=A0A6B3NA86_9CYAN|nr:ATP-binding protein [Symploca sp. SIO1C4]
MHPFNSIVPSTSNSQPLAYQQGSSLTPLDDGLTGGLGQALVQEIVLRAWEAGQSTESILADCSKHMNRQDAAWARLIVEELEVNYRPTPVEIGAYKLRLRDVFRKNPTSAAMEKIAAETNNIYLKKIAQQAVAILRQAEANGRSPANQTAANVKLAHVLEIICRCKVSVLLFGNSGSGKSSVACLIISYISRNRSITKGKIPQILVLDPHVNDWGRMPVVHKGADILRTLHLVVKELERRQENWANQVENLPESKRKKDWFYLIVVWDEIGGTLAYAKTEEGKKLIKEEGLIHPSDALLRLGSELRKFEGMFFGLNQSGNCEAIGIDSSYRNNFVDVHLCESALMQIESWDHSCSEYQFVYSRRDGYPCVVRGKPALHPSHSQHTVFAEGSPPIEFEPAQQEPLTLRLPVKPLVFRGELQDSYVGHLLPAASSTPSGSAPEKQKETESDNDQLYQLFLSIKAGRSQNPPLTKTKICESWGGRTQLNHQRYDEALDAYAAQWVAEFVSDGELQIRCEDLIELIWSVTPHRRHKEKFRKCKQILEDILASLGVIPPWQNPPNIIKMPLRKGNEKPAIDNRQPAT